MTGRISFVLGAGFSAPFNIPTMRPFLTSFRTFANRKYPSLKETLEGHVAKLTEDSDIEGLLSSLGKAEELPDAMPSRTDMDAGLARWASESRSIRAHLVSYIIERCEQFDRERAEGDIAKWLERLNTSNELSAVHFFTTNYDRILEYVSENAGIQLDDGFATSESDLVAPWTGNFASKLRLYKLHGSVTYYVDRKSPPAKEFLRLDRGYSLPDPDFRLSRKGRELEPLMVLPTFEKNATGDPYGHLMHVFTETLSDGGLVVAMGTSLRDAHLVSAMNFNRKKIVVLVIDEAPDLAISEMPNVRTVSLKADMSECFKYFNLPLVELAERCAAIADSGELFDIVNKFSAEQSDLLRVSRGMSDEQRQQIDILRQADGQMSKLEAIRRLQGVRHPEIMSAVASCLTQETLPAIRKAIAGCLGLSKNPEFIAALADLANLDHSPDVRLESYLALQEIGGKAAMDALAVAKGSWPEDPFFWEAEQV